jgi:hypothetical protein
LVALLIVIAAVGFGNSYQRWLDPIIDTGRDLYIPEHLAHGAKLYRDIRYQYPPLAPYLLTLITAVIGRSLAAYTAIGVAQSVVIVAALWLIGRRTAGPIAGFVAALLFVALNFCGASTWGANFLFPYSYAATMGMAFLLVSLALFVHQRPSWALTALLAASWCKVEYAIAAVFVVIVLAAARRITLRQLGAFAAAGVITVSAAVLYFPQLRENVFAAALTKGESARNFFRFVAGVSEWPQNLSQAALAVVGIVAIVWLLRSMNSRIAVPVVIAISILLASHAFFRAWGLLQIVALVQGFRERNPTLLTLSAFSIASTLRILLNVSPAWYGFVLIVPLYALIAYVLFAYLPQRGVSGSIWWIPLIAFLCGRDLGQQRERYAVKSFAITSPHGTFYDSNPDRARVLNEFIGTVRDGTLAVMPEGITLNYLTGRPTSLSFHTFTPVETADPAVEQSIIDELLKRPPERVAIVSRDVREYGYRGFGIDYDRRVMSYLFANYRVERHWSEPRFRLVLMHAK